MGSALPAFERLRKQAAVVALAVSSMPFLMVVGRDVLPGAWLRNFITSSEWVRPLSLSQFIDPQVRERLLSGGGPVARLNAAYLDWIGTIEFLALLIAIPLVLVGIIVNGQRLGLATFLTWIIMIAFVLFLTMIFVETSLKLDSLGGQLLLAGGCLGLLWLLVGAVSATWLPETPQQKLGSDADGSGAVHIPDTGSCCAGGSGDGGGASD